MALEVVHHLDVLDEGWTDRSGVTGYGVEPYIPRTEFMFSPADYSADSSTFYPEVVATNPTGSAIDVTIVSSPVGTVVGTVSIPAGVTAKRLRGDAITWPSGNNKYAWMIGTGASNVEFYLYSGRLVCSHLNPEKLKIWHPLLNYTETPDGVVNQIEDFNNGINVTFVAWSGVFIRNDAEDFCNTRSWTIESNMGKSSGNINGEWGLWNVTLGQRVMASRMTGNTAGTAELKTTSWSSDPAWVDGHSYRWYWAEITTSIHTMKTFGARLYTHLSGDITKVTTRCRIGKGGGTGLVVTNNASRVLFESTESLQTVSTETSANNSSGTGQVDTIDGTTNDDGSAGSAVAGAAITVSTTRTVHTSSTWAATEGNRYISKDYPLTLASSIHIDWVLLKMVWEAMVTTAAVCPPTAIVGDTSPYAILLCPEVPCDYP